MFEVLMCKLRRSVCCRFGRGKRRGLPWLAICRQQAGQVPRRCCQRRASDETSKGVVTSLLLTVASECLDFPCREGAEFPPPQHNTHPQATHTLSSSYSASFAQSLRHLLRFRIACDRTSFLGRSPSAVSKHAQAYTQPTMDPDMNAQLAFRNGHDPQQG